VCTAGLVLLYLLNLRLSETINSNSDSAGPVLQGWAMMHGNILQHGWITADVPYYPTEVTEYGLISLITGLSSTAVHVGGAFTYTMLMLFAALVAMGKPGLSSPRQRAGRAAIAMGIMLAPQFNAGTYVLLLGPDHTGTALPVLVAWLIIDRAGDPAGFGPWRRWGIPVAMALILIWTGLADETTPFIASVPLAGVYAYRALLARARRGVRLTRQGHELAMVAAGLVSAAAAFEARRIFHVLGSVSYIAPHTGFSPLNVIFWHNFGVMVQCLQILTGSYFYGLHSRWQLALALLHLVGTALVAAGILLAAWRFARDKDVISQLLVAGIALNLLAFVVGVNSQEWTFAREIAPVLSLGAALAGRLLAPLLFRRWQAAPWLAPAAAGVLSVVLLGYLCGLGYEDRQPKKPVQLASLIPFLKAHHLTYGLGGYWAANAITLDTGGQIQIRALSDLSNLTPVIAMPRPDDVSWYDPKLHYANFVVLYQQVPGIKPFTIYTGLTRFPYDKGTIMTFGQPARVYHYQLFTIMVWNKNLLDDIAPPSVAMP
jgi:hypothetical protein